VKRYKTEIVADNVILLSSPAGEGGGGYSAPQSSSASFDAAPEEPRVKKSKPKAEEEIAIEDIPF
jgi:single-stranded DNA-binding protein